MIRTRSAVYYVYVYNVMVYYHIGIFLLRITRWKLRKQKEKKIHITSLQKKRLFNLFTLDAVISPSFICTIKLKIWTVYALKTLWIAWGDMLYQVYGWKEERGLLVVTFSNYDNTAILEAQFDMPKLNKVFVETLENGRDKYKYEYHFYGCKRNTSICGHYILKYFEPAII